MPILYADRVKDTSTTSGFGDFTLVGATITGFQTPAAAFGFAGNSFYYCIEGGAEWEVGEGHLSTATNLVRDTVFASSNGGTVVTFSAGTKTVFCTIPAAKIIRPRLTSVTAGNFTAGADALTDYVYLVAGLHTGTLPTAVGNKNVYTIKNNHSANVTLGTTAAELVEGAATISIPPANSVDIVSNGSNWFVV